VLQRPVWLPLVVSGRRETSSPAASPGSRREDQGDGGSAPGVVQRFALRRVGEDSCPVDGRGQLMPGGRRAVQHGGRLRPERAAAVGGGRGTMYEDVRWFPGVPGAPAGLTPR
jgi:hypothetical protein